MYAPITAISSVQSSVARLRERETERENSSAHPMELDFFRLDGQRTDARAIMHTAHRHARRDWAWSAAVMTLEDVARQILIFDYVGQHFANVVGVDRDLLAFFVWSLEA
jgi:hypothetical protein